MTRNKNRKEDVESGAQDRVSKTHGGEVVEAISPEELVLINDPDCKHEKLVRDETETEFNAFICSNHDCGVVVLFNKN